MKQKSNELSLQNALKGKKAFFFDLDGTLLDTEPLHFKALTKTLIHFNKIINYEGLSERFHGDSDETVYHAIFKDKIYPTLAHFIDKKNEILTEIIENLEISELEDLLTDGALHLLCLLSKQNSLIGLVSASEESIVNLILERLNLSSFFHTKRSRSDTFLSKPNPSPYLSTMRELGVSPSEVVIFEDSPPGVQAAIETGATVFQICQNLSEILENQKNNRLFKIDNFLWQK